MRRLKFVIGSVAGVLVLTFLALWGARAYNHSKINQRMTYHESLRTGIRLQCFDDNEETRKDWEQAVLRQNEVVRHRRDRNRSGFIGDYVTPDIWEFVDPIVIPSEMECAKLVRDSHVRQCVRFLKGDWRQEFDALNCGVLLGPAYNYR
jgi:hypothetical protein